MAGISLDAAWNERRPGCEAMPDLWAALPAEVQATICDLMVAYGHRLILDILPCESPIEQILGARIAHMARLDGFELKLNPQAEIVVNGRRYRADFLLQARINGREVALVVECDGHDFHEKTKTQAARDKQRDRSLQLAGYAVLHYTGAEIWKNPLYCAIEIIHHLKTMAGVSRRGCG
ncbi:MAG: DUF559 domain-containing protein [Bacillota bacterium]|nr:DUF559 domain-containing protein [Bacillota bacterium]